MGGMLSSCTIDLKIILLSFESFFRAFEVEIIFRAFEEKAFKKNFCEAFAKFRIPKINAFNLKTHPLKASQKKKAFLKFLQQFSSLSKSFQVRMNILLNPSKVSAQFKTF